MDLKAGAWQAQVDMDEGPSIIRANVKEPDVHNVTKKIRATLVAFVLIMATLFSTISSPVKAQDAAATPEATNAACPENPDNTQKVVVVTTSIDHGLVVVREADNGRKIVNVYAKCLDGEKLTAKAGMQAVNIWAGYPNMEYAQNDACRQAQADAADAAVAGNWNAGYTVLYNAKPIPPTCGTDRPIRSTQKDEVVPAGTVVILETVNFETKAIDVRALVLEDDVQTIFTSAYRLQMWVGYADLAAAQADVCAQATREAATAAIENGWNEGFVVTVDDGKPLSGCPTS